MSFKSRNSTKQLLPFGLDYSDVLDMRGTAEKPELILPVNGQLTDMETDAASQSIAFAQLMADGPFYTGSIADAKQGRKSTTNTMAADGIQRYLDRYKKVKKIGRTIEEHPYQLEFFPDELYSVMGILNKQKKKLLALSTFKSNGGLKEYNVNDTDEDQAKSIMDKMKDLAEEMEDGKDEEEEEPEEDVDDEFEEDDDDDYNAEKYFDDGDEDVGDGDDDEAHF